MNVQTIMSASPYTLDSDATLADAVELMSNEGVRHVPIVEGKRVVGIITDRDVKMALGPDAQSLDLGAIDPRLAEGPLSWFMSEDVVAVDIEDSVASVCEHFIKLKVGALPVVDEFKIVGIVSVVDVLRAAHPLLAQTDS